jgi:hypothetical protein
MHLLNFTIQGSKKESAIVKCLLSDAWCIKEMNISLKGTINLSFPFSADKITVVWKSADILRNMAVFSFRTMYHQQWLGGDGDSQVLQNVSKQSHHKTLS